MKCTTHCSACGAHFNSLEAFDAHRSGSYTSGRKCRSPRKVKKLEHVVGTCDIIRVLTPTGPDNYCEVSRLRDE